MPERSLERRMGIAAVLMIGSVFLSRAIGYIRDAVIAYFYGATRNTDAYFAAFTLPDFLNYLMAGGALSITFIPIFSGYLTRGEEEKGWRTLSTIVSTMSVSLLGLIVVGELLAPRVVPMLVPGFEADQLSETIYLTRIVLPAQFFFYVGGVLSGVLYAKEAFLIPALSPLIYNLCIIGGGVLLRPWMGIAGFSWGVLAGAILGPFLLPWIRVRQIGGRVTPSLNLRDRGFIEFVKLSIPIMLGMSLVAVDEWIARYFGSALTVGTITWINNARRLMMVPVSVLGQAAGRATLPFFARLASEGKQEELSRVVETSLKLVLYSTIAAGFWMILLAREAVSVVYGRGQYSPSDVSATATILVFFSLGIFAWGVQAIAARAFYAMKDAITPMILGTTVTAFSLPIYWTLVRELQGRGLALATSVGMMVYAGAIVLMLCRKMGQLSVQRLAGTFGKTLLAAGTASIIGHIALVGLDQVGDWSSTMGSLLRIVLISGAWAMAVGALSILLRIQEFEVLSSRLRRKLAWSRTR